MSNSPMVPIFAPDGTLGAVPYERLHDALGAGGKMAVRIQAPNSSDIGYIPADRANDAVKAGGKTVGPEPVTEKSWLNLSDVGTAAKNRVAGQIAGEGSLSSIASRALDPTNAKGNMETLANMVHEAKAGWERAGDPRAKIGEAFLSALGIPVGMSAERAAQQAKEGKGSEILGEAAVPAAETLAGYGVAKVVPAITKALPSTERAGASLADIKSTVGDVPVDMEKPGNTALELWTQSERGANLPAVVRKFVQRATKPGSEPITYAEAKDFQSNVSSLSADEKMAMKPNTKRLLGQLNADLKDSLTGAADTAGKGEQFVKAMKEYHNAMRIGNLSEEIKANLWKAALTSAGIYGAKKLWDAAQ